MLSVKKGFIFTLICVYSQVGMTSGLYARDRDVYVRSEDHFEEQIRKNDFSVAMFYEKGQRDNDELEEMFGDASDNDTYRDAGLKFLRINVSKSRELKDLAESFFVPSFPAFILFNGDKPEVDTKGKIIYLTGFVSIKKLHTFIDDYLGHDLKKAIVQEDDDDDDDDDDYRYARYRRPYYRPYYRPYLSYPYSYYGRPYYRPYFGFGIGRGFYGLGRGRGYGYRRGGYHRGRRHR